MARNIKARRKLSELYRKGVELRFGPDGGVEGPFDSPATEDEVAVWIQPPSPLQREMALRDAQAARAKAILRTKRDDDSEERLTSMAFVAEMSFPTLVEYLLAMGADDRRNEATRDVLAKDEWKDIIHLQDAMRQYDSGEKEKDEDDPEYQALMEADTRYGDQVRDREKELIDAARQALEMLPREELEKRALDMRSELVGSQVFMHEYERQMTFYSVRDPEDHDALFFESASEYAEQDDIVQTKIADVLAKYINEAAEAKNSPGAVDGSPQSTPPSEEETSAASTPEDASD